MAISEHEMSSMLSPKSFWKPDFLLDHSAWFEHGPFAFWIADAIRPKVFAELGTHTGYSFMAFCQVFSATTTDVEAVAIDTWEGDEHAGFYGNEIFERLEHEFKARGYDGFARLSRKTFAEAVVEFDDGSIDLLHIDGRHFAKDVREDFETYLPKMSDSGVVLFHDTNVFERGFGVHEVWAELKEQYPSFEFKHGHGLGVLAVGEKVPDVMTRFFEATSTPEGTDFVRDTYSSLGASITTDYARHVAEEDARRWFSEAAQLNNQNESLQKQNESLGRKLAKAESRGKKQEEQLAIFKSRFGYKARRKAASIVRKAN